MAYLQTFIEIAFTGMVLLIAGLALAAYYLLFYVVMIALDGCEICKWTRRHLSSNANGHTLSKP